MHYGILWIKNGKKYWHFPSQFSAQFWHDSFKFYFAMHKQVHSEIWKFQYFLTPFLDQNVPLCCGLTATADCYLQRSIWRWQKTIHFSKAGKRSKTFLIFLLQQSRKYLRFLAKYFTQIRNRIWSLYWDIFVDEKSMFFELRIGIRKSSERERERERVVWSIYFVLLVN